MDEFQSNFLSIICLAFLCLLLLMSLYLKHHSQAIDYWLFLGSLPSLVWNSNRLFEWATEVFSSLGRGSFIIDGPIFSKLRYLATCHPNNIEYILKTNFNNFPKGEDFREVFDILGDGIFNVDSDSWRVQRRMAHAGVSPVEFKTLVANMSRKVVEEQLVPILIHVAKKGSSIDLQEVCLRFAFDSSISVIFGRHERYLSLGLPSNELAKAADEVQEAILYRHTMPIFLWKTLRWLGVGRERNLFEAHKKIDSIFQEYISQKREDLVKGVKTVDLLSSYINALEDDKSVSLAKNDKFLRDAMFSFFIAGRDTIASGLSWFFWLVSKSPSVEMKILEELKLAVLSRKKRDDEAKCKNDGAVTRETEWRPLIFDSDDLKGLVYMHAALCESLRLYPPVPLNSKSVLKEDVLPDGTLVKPGMQIILSFYSVGRMPWIWGEDCLEFKPERWIDDDGKLSFEPMSKFFAFNAGPRSCLGKDISFTQMKSVVAAVLFNFHVEVVEGHLVCPKPFINLHMKNGLKVNIKRRAI
ncbi:Cytochrome P450 [Macleaya cordata]|uniref:Cytochrome P450 n=1 Tax=Macleaya cordata TaxID=56857 RepID=A0A200PM86_MACCD|nr:Cytochrome P450 [Macleaya cordata]